MTMASIEAISGLSVAVPSRPDAENATPGPFVKWLEAEVSRTSAAVSEADLQLSRLASGQATSLHQVMLSLEDARMSMQLLVQVRNRLLDAYQEVIRMQV